MLIDVARLMEFTNYLQTLKPLTGLFLFAGKKAGAKKGKKHLEGEPIKRKMFHVEHWKVKSERGKK